MPGIKSVLSFTGRVIGYIFLMLSSAILIGAGLSEIFCTPITPGNLPVSKVTGTLAVQPEVELPQQKPQFY